MAEQTPIHAVTIVAGPKASTANTTEHPRDVAGQTPDVPANTRDVSNRTPPPRRRRKASSGRSGEGE